MKLLHGRLYRLSLNENKQYINNTGKMLLANEVSNELISQLHSHFMMKNNKSYAQFSSELDDSFEQALRSWVSKADNFVHFSQYIFDLLIQNISQYHFMDSGYFLIAEYQHVTGQFLLLTILQPKSSLFVNDSMDIEDNDYLDLNNLQLTVMIDLFKWQEERDLHQYISFIKGRLGRKVSDFFFDFLGCKEALNVKEQNKMMLDALSKCINHSDLDEQEKEIQRENILDYCVTQQKNHNIIELSEITEKLSEQGVQNFSDFITENECMAEAFPADLSTIKQLKKMTGSGGGVTIGFDAILLGERVIWNEEEDRLVILGVPPNLKEQLKRRKLR